MGKRKSTESEIHAACQSIAKKIATLSDMIADGRLSDSLTAGISAMAANRAETKKHRGAKPVKDPRAPTRNLTSYIHYTNDNRKKIVDANPGMAPRDVARTLGEGWRGLNEKEKARYDQLAKDDLKRYNDEMKVYKESAEGDIDNASANNANNNNSSNNDDDDESESDSDDEEDELASDDPPPKIKPSKKVLKAITNAKAKIVNNNDDDASDSSSSSSSSSSSEESSSSSESSDSE